MLARSQLARGNVWTESSDELYRVTFAAPHNSQGFNHAPERPDGVQDAQIGIVTVRSPLLGVCLHVNFPLNSFGQEYGEDAEMDLPVACAIPLSVPVTSALTFGELLISSRDLISAEQCTADCRLP